jgi:hypothetical protein
MLFVIFAGACLISFLVARALRKSEALVTLGPPAPSRVAETARDTDPAFHPSKYERTVYPYSVIPGGVRSREELAFNISNDRVVASHFAEFAVSRARMVRMDVTQNVYVSYRIRNKVFWTAKTVKIPQGEALVTDGRDYARARCGNRISVLPQTPVSEEEPEPEVFDIPVLARVEPPEPIILPESGLELPVLPESELSLREFPPIEPYLPMPTSPVLPYYDRPPFAVFPPGGVAIPEPGTFGLLLAGLTAFFVLRHCRKK